MYSKFSCLGMWKANAVLHCVPCLKTDTTPLEQLVHATHPFLNSPKFVYYSPGSHCKATAITEMQSIVRTDHIRLASGWVPTSCTFLRSLTRGTHSSYNAWFSSRAPMTLGDTAVSCRDCWLTGVCFTAYCRGEGCFTQTTRFQSHCVSASNENTAKSLQLSVGRSLKYQSTELNPCTYFIWGYYRQMRLYSLHIY